MKKIERDIVVIGAGPAGLSAAIAASQAGAQVLVVDENSLPGGQLFKQIHRFFGSVEHCAGTRGYAIARELCTKAGKLGVEVLLDTVAYGFFEDGIGLVTGDDNYLVKSKKTILAAGGSENMVAFPGCTLPGVMSAGAAQTMANVHRVLPGRRVVMLGSGNVGLIVAYQLLQAGAEVVALAECADHIGGYGVHAAKLRRAGVPIYTGCTVKRALGTESLEAVELAKPDGRGGFVEGSERLLEADTLCVAVGLSPMAELAWQAGAQFEYTEALGGFVPVHDACMETTVQGLYAAGDVTGVEEAPVAMEEGNLAGTSAAEALGYLSAEEAAERRAAAYRRLDFLRGGERQGDQR